MLESLKRSDSMNRDKKLNIIGQLLLFGATLCWGTSFFIFKETIEEVPSFYAIAVRFILSGLAFCLIFFKRLKKFDKKTIFGGFIMGLCVFFAYAAQTEGLKHTTAGRNAFLTALYCIICPFLLWLFFKKRPKIYNVISAVLCIIGVGLVALSGDSGATTNVFLGDALTLVGAVFFALQIVAIDKCQSDGQDSILLLIIELLTVGVFSAISSLIFELPTIGVNGYSLNADQIIKIAYLMIACTLFAQFAQIYGQKFTTANQSAIILSLESVFGVLFSVLFAGEKLTVMIVAGFVVIFMAILMSELKIDPIKMFANKKKESQSDKENIN